MCECWLNVIVLDDDLCSTILIINVLHVHIYIYLIYNILNIIDYARACMHLYIFGRLSKKTWKDLDTTSSESQFKAQLLFEPGASQTPQLLAM